jgi:hypothetical protein
MIANLHTSQIWKKNCLHKLFFFDNFLHYGEKENWKILEIIGFIYNYDSWAMKKS